jgi:hypothetical protein
VILRRLAQSLKSQHWMAIAIEFVLLVSGVFLGIQVANWNEAQKDKQREAEFITRLTRDFEKIDARLDLNIEAWTKKAKAPVRVRDDIKAFRAQGTWPRPEAAILVDLDDSFDSRIPAPRASTYVELLSAGQLGLIRNTRLRDALLDYDMQVGYSQTAYNVLMQRVAPHMDTLTAHMEFDQNADTSANALYAKNRHVWIGLDLHGLEADPKTVPALNMYASASSNQLMVARVQQQRALAVMALLKPGSKPATGTAP